MPDRSGTGPSLFRQIARRLVQFTSLAQELLSLEVERIAGLADPSAGKPPDAQNWSASIVRPRTAADAVLIDWTRRNLIDNALAHAPGETCIDVAAGPGPQISVRDHGPGIAAADQAHLYERFWRKDRSHSQGAGLGPGIVKRLVDAHDGTMVIESPGGGGALFRVRFPPATAVHPPRQRGHV